MRGRGRSLSSEVIAMLRVWRPHPHPVPLHVWLQVSSEAEINRLSAQLDSVRLDPLSPTDIEQGWLPR